MGGFVILVTPAGVCDIVLIVDTPSSEENRPLHTKPSILPYSLTYDILFPRMQNNSPIFQLLSPIIMSLYHYYHIFVSTSSIDTPGTWMFVSIYRSLVGMEVSIVLLMYIY